MSYPAKLKALAIRLHEEHHLGPTQIRRVMLTQLPAGTRVPERTTISLWLKTTEAQDRQRARDAANQQLRRRQQLGMHRQAWDRDMLVLRRAGISYFAISVALEHFHGARMTPETVRHRCRQLGAPPKPHGVPFPTAAAAAAA